jgi:hypothetical protein
MFGALATGCASGESDKDARTDAGDDGGCSAGLTECSGICVDLDSDHENCGGCGNACDPAEVCFEGGCSLECPSGLENCSGGCVDLDEDVSNCGACGRECEGGEHADPVCVSGVCEAACHAGWCDPDGDGDCDTACSSDTEVCNGADDDGDGLVDEDFDCIRGEVENDDCEACGTRSRTCSSSCTWGSWSACVDTGCMPGTTQNCGTCGYQTCNESCEWGSCGNVGLEMWQRCNDCGVQYCNGSGTAWGACTGPFDACPSGETCNTSGECVAPCTADFGACSSDSECCSGTCCRCAIFGCSDCNPSGHYDEFCDDDGSMTCHTICINVCNSC